MPSPEQAQPHPTVPLIHPITKRWHLLRRLTRYAGWSLALFMAVSMVSSVILVSIVTFATNNAHGFLYTLAFAPTMLCTAAFLITTLLAILITPTLAALPPTKRQSPSPVSASPALHAVASLSASAFFLPALIATLITGHIQTQDTQPPLAHLLTPSAWPIASNIFLCALLAFLPIEVKAIHRFARAHAGSPSPTFHIPGFNRTLIFSLAALTFTLYQLMAQTNPNLEPITLLGSSHPDAWTHAQWFLSISFILLLWTRSIAARTFINHANSQST